jgi:hypothetical protein
MAIPYQPNYKLQPKTGFRYSAQPFAPPTQPINAPPPLGLDGSAAAPPPTMGGQQGPAYANDPFGGGDNQAESDRLQANTQSRINQAESYGYTRGTQNPMNFLRAVPILGTAMSAMGAFDNLPDQTYGQPGTYDNAGNVFSDNGRAYDPITGKPAQSYARMTGENSWLGNAYGIGTEEGIGGPSSSYGKLRSWGEDIPNSVLGSYDNSVYNQMDSTMTTVDGIPTYGMDLQGARNARRRGANSPIENLANDITLNTIASNRPSTTAIDDIIDPGPVWGTKPGDYFQLDSGPAVVSSSGQLKSKDGTTVMVDGTSLVNTNINDWDSLNPAQKAIVQERTSDGTGNPDGSPSYDQNVNADNYQDMGTTKDSKGNTVMGAKTNPYGDSFEGTSDTGGK